MKMRKLRDIEVSEVGMGCMALSHGYGKIPSEEYSIEAIRNAYNHGCTLFDTAEVYSPNLSGIGHNELIPLLKEYWFDEPVKVKNWTDNQLTLEEAFDVWLQSQPTSWDQPVNKMTFGRTGWK